MTQELFSYYAKKASAKHKYGYWMRWKKYLSKNTSFAHVHHLGELYYLTMVHHELYTVFCVIERMRRDD